VPLKSDRREGSIQETVRIDQSAWFSLTAEGPAGSHPLDALYPQAATSAVRVYVGEQKIRNKHSAEYFIRWIDTLQTMAEAWSGWRSPKERSHVLGQFSDARDVYRRLSREAPEK
jgi:hypothetical protein